MCPEGLTPCFSPLSFRWTCLCREALVSAVLVDSLPQPSDPSGLGWVLLCSLPSSLNSQPWPESTGGCPESCNLHHRKSYLKPGLMLNIFLSFPSFSFSKTPTFPSVPGRYLFPGVNFLLIPWILHSLPFSCYTSWYSFWLLYHWKKPLALLCAFPQLLTNHIISQHWVPEGFYFRVKSIVVVQSP